MGRSPCCDENGLKKGPWTPEEDHKLTDYIHKHGPGSWRAMPKPAGLNRCGKSCRLRWTNYLRPDIKRGKFSPEEEQAILQLHSILGNKWSAIAKHLPRRTDNEIKNFWNTHLKKKMIRMGFDPTTHRPRADFLAALPEFIANLCQLAEHRPLDYHTTQQLQADGVQASKLEYLLQSMLQSASVLIATNPSSSSLLSPPHMSSLSFPGIMEGINGQYLLTGQEPNIQIPSSSFFQQPIINGTIHNLYYTGEGENSLPSLADFSSSNLAGACSVSGSDAQGNSVQHPIWSESFYDQFMSELA